MKRVILYVFCLANLFACNGQDSKSKKDNIPLDLESKVDKLVKEYTDLGIFSGVVLIADEGEPIYHKAFGLANQGTKTPNKLDTRFDIGSMNKSMTKVLILKLVKAGKFKLDDKLGQFLDGFPKVAAKKISINHLLNHQSGYGDYHTPEYREIPLEEKSLAVSVDFIKKLPMLFEPGKEQEYSNAGYVLLGAIAEKVTGKSYYDLIEEYITKPLKMENTFLRNKYNVTNRAVGYFKNFKGELMDNEDFQEIPTPAGGFYSTTEDMLTFYRAFHYGNQLWDEATRSMDEMYGFYQEHQNTGGAMTHAGGFEGANTVHYEILRDKISVIVFANMDEPVAENLGAGILAIIREKKPESPTLPATQLVYKTWKEKGPDYVRKNWETLTANFHPSDPKDLILNVIGYDLFFNGEIDEALENFKLNTELFPNIGNCWDSYGEALLKKGRKEEALQAYKKALEINPNIPSAKKGVKELEGK